MPITQAIGRIVEKFEETVKSVAEDPIVLISCNMLYYKRHFWSRNFSLWRYQLATKVMRFNTIRLLDRVYALKPSTLEQLKTNIYQVMAQRPPNMCQKMVENYLKRINACNTSRGGHLNDVVFHT